MFDLSGRTLPWHLPTWPPQREWHRPDELIYVLNRSAAPRLIVPTWRRAEILRDTGRLQLAGTVTLTGAMFATVIVAGTDLWSRRTIETQ